MSRWTLPVLGLFLLLPAGGRGQPQDQAPDLKPIPRGIRWLVKAQSRDGSWGLDAHTPSEISCTVVAALALMAGGNTERGGPDPECVECVRKALAFILQRARRMKGNISGGEVTLVQNKLGHHAHTFF